jgi:hypothetical protein
MLQLLEKYKNVKLGGTRSEFIDRLFDKGIVISCGEDGQINIASVETWLKYAEAVGLTAAGEVPAIGQTTTTTTTIQ